MTITVTVTRKQLVTDPKSKYAKYCTWCVKVDTDDPDGFGGEEGLPVPLQWAVDFSSDIDILDPDEARGIPGAPNYWVDPDPDQGTFTKPGDTSFEICFVAACASRYGTEMSLENRLRKPPPPPGESVLPQPWVRVPFKDGPKGVEKILGPAPK